jgi:hypothetical protein
MAHRQDFPQAALQAIARQIAERRPVAPFGLAPPGAALQIAESFPVWMLQFDPSMPADTDLHKITKETGHWQHQVRNHRGTKQIARSITPSAGAPEQTRLVELSTTPIAGKIDEAIKWIDEHVPGDPLARILVVPAVHVTTFWLEENNASQIVLVSRPDSFENLRYNHLYPAAEFLRELYRHRPLGKPPGEVPNPAPLKPLLR